MLILPPPHQSNQPFLPKPTKERVVNATITSRLDYCNAILYGSSVVNIARTFLPKPTKERVVNATITSRLDYCNAILYGSSVVNIARTFLPKPTKERVVNATITPRLDYCNALLYGTSVVNIARLQQIHNSAVRLILRRPRSDNARSLLQELHWLPVARRVDLKILLFTYKAMQDEVPVYLCELVRPYQLARALRSASSNSLEVKRTRTKAGGGSFAVAAASLWNTLPNFIKTCDTLASFKCRLKTHFFRIAY